MTTIAWDGRLLAADRMMVGGGTKRSTRKLFVSRDYVYAGCGPLPHVHLVAAWLKDGAKPDKTLVFLGKECGGVLGIVVRRADVRAYLIESLEGPTTFIPVRGRFMADGSGRDAAIAAMLLGQNAREAVVIASRVDASTGMGVDVYDFGDRSKRRRK